MKKLLVILGILGVSAYVFRDRIAAGAVLLVEKANGLSHAVGQRLFVDDESDDEQIETLIISKENK